MSKSEGGNRMKCANKIPWSELNFKCLKETDKIVAKLFTVCLLVG